MTVAQIRFQLAVGITTMIAALEYATAYVALNDWFGRGDLIAMMTWSLPLAFGVPVFMTALSARISRAGLPLTFAVLAASGAILGALWTLLVALVLSVWI